MNISLTSGDSIPVLLCAMLCMAFAFVFAIQYLATVATRIVEVFASLVEIRGRRFRRSFELRRHRLNMEHEEQRRRAGIISLRMGNISPEELGEQLNRSWKDGFEHASKPFPTPAETMQHVEDEDVEVHNEKLEEDPNWMRFQEIVKRTADSAYQLLYSQEEVNFLQACEWLHLARYNKIRIRLLESRVALEKVYMQVMPLRHAAEAFIRDWEGGEFDLPIHMACAVQTLRLELYGTDITTVEKNVRLVVDKHNEKLVQLNGVLGLRIHIKKLEYELLRMGTPSKVSTSEELRTTTTSKPVSVAEVMAAEMTKMVVEKVDATARANLAPVPVACVATPEEKLAAKRMALRAYGFGVSDSETGDILCWQGGLYLGRTPRDELAVTAYKRIRNDLIVQGSQIQLPELPPDREEPANPIPTQETPPKPTIATQNGVPVLGTDYIAKAPGHNPPTTDVDTTFDHRQ